MFAILLLGSDAENRNIFEYEYIANNIIKGYGFSYDFGNQYPNSLTAWVAPVYPYLLVGYYYLFGSSLTGIVFIQALIAGVVCWGLAYIGLIIGGKFVGAVAAIIYALYPEMIFMAQIIVPEPWLILWMVLMLICTIKYINNNLRFYALISGFWAGIAILTKESAIIYPFLLLIWIWLKKKPSRKLILDSLLLVSVAICIVTPWTIRNYLVFKSFIPVRTNFWVNAWRGNHPNATGTARSLDGRLIDDVADSSYYAELETKLTGNEVQRESVYRLYALRFIKAEPLSYLKLCLRRVFYFWTIDPTHTLARQPLYWIPWMLLFTFSAIGAVSSIQRWKDYSFWYLGFALTTLAYSLTLVLPRYRIPLLPGLMLLAAEGIRKITDKVWKPSK